MHPFLFILSAYGMTFTLLGALVVASLWRARRIRRLLARAQQAAQA